MSLENNALTNDKSANAAGTSGHICTETAPATQTPIYKESGEDAEFHVAAWRGWRADKALAYRRSRDKTAPARCRGLAQTYGRLLKVDVPAELRLALLTAAACDQVLPSVQEVLVKYRPILEAATASIAAQPASELSHSRG